MNTASRLSKKAKNVFILDFDLEAPGIDVFSTGDTVKGPGLVEYISHYSESGQILPLKDFVSEMHLRLPGRVFWMPAGRKDTRYQALLAQLNWKQFYREREGFLFVENLKAAIHAEYQPDYVLVDSRTGLTDISGICTLQLPDLVVLLFGLNNHNLEGTAQIFRAIKHNAIKRQVDTMLVASPVPDIPDIVGIRRERLQKARDLLGSEPELILPYNAFVAFQETVLPNEIGAFLNNAYDHLTDEIISKNKFDITTLLREARRIRDAGEVELAQRKYKEIVEAHSQSAQAWHAYGTFLRSTRHYEEALNAYIKAREFGASVRVIGDIAATYLALNDFENAANYLSSYLQVATNAENVLRLAELFESRDRVRQAEEAYRRAYELQQDDEEADGEVLYDLGNLYLRMGEPDKAVRCYRKLLNTFHHQLGVTFNLGLALSRMGKRQEAVDYFTRSVEMFERQEYTKSMPALDANRSQAMSQAYAYLGKSSKAMELLSESIKIAESLRESPIYSSIQYKNISASEFQEESLKLLSSFERAAAVNKDHTAAN